MATSVNISEESNIAQIAGDPSLLPSKVSSTTVSEQNSVEGSTLSTQSSTSLEPDAKYQSPSFHSSKNISMSRKISVHPAHLLRSPVLNRAKRLPASGILRTDEMRLSAEQLKSQRMRKLKSWSRRRVDAEIMYHQAAQLEHLVLLHASNAGENFTKLSADTALALARSSCNVLKAERQAYSSQAKEYKMKLLVLQDLIDDTRARSEDADFQLRTVLNIIKMEHLPVITLPDNDLLSDIRHRHDRQLDASSDCTSESSEEAEGMDYELSEVDSDDSRSNPED